MEPVGTNRPGTPALEAGGQAGDHGLPFPLLLHRPSLLKKEKWSSLLKPGERKNFRRKSPLHLDLAYKIK